MELTLYLENGKTLRFENVTDLKKGEKFFFVITFNYVSMSDGKKKKAIFSTKNVLGLSVNEEGLRC